MVLRVLDNWENSIPSLLVTTGCRRRSKNNKPNVLSGSPNISSGDSKEAADDDDIFLPS